MAIKYVKGDATDPQGAGNKFIVHCCNDVGAWGSGFVMALSKKWRAPEQCYRAWFDHGDLEPFALGNIQTVLVESGFEKDADEKDIPIHTYVINCIAQRGIGMQSDGIPLRYDALETCLTKVAKVVRETGNASIVGPRFGAGLAGGSWTKIEEIINRVCDGINVVIYDL